MYKEIFEDLCVLLDNGIVTKIKYKAVPNAISNYIDFVDETAVITKCVPRITATESSFYILCETEDGKPNAEYIPCVYHGKDCYIFMIKNINNTEDYSVITKLTSTVINKRIPPHSDASEKYALGWFVRSCAKVLIPVALSVKVYKGQFNNKIVDCFDTRFYTITEDIIKSYLEILKGDIDSNIEDLLDNGSILNISKQYNNILYWRLRKDKENDISETS